MSGIATAIVGSAVVGGVLASNSQEGAAKTAASAEERSAALSIEESRRQFDKLQEVLKPYMEAGTTALTQQQALIGLGGPQKQTEAIKALEGSPQFTSLMKQGENAILQNASATGGLRGGNVQRALAEFRPSLLSQIIENQYQKLSGLTQIGQASAAGVGAGAINTGNVIGQTLQQSGQAQAQAALAGGAAKAGIWGDIAGSIGTVAGLSKGSFGTF